MDKKTSKSFDILEDLLYDTFVPTLSIEPSSYEKHIIELMVIKDITLQEALMADLVLNDIDASSLVYIIDYFESKVRSMKTVSFLMSIYVGLVPNFKLKPL